MHIANNSSLGFTLTGYCPCQIAKVERGKNKYSMIVARFIFVALIIMSESINKN